jgi:hypothetical protein
MTTDSARGEYEGATSGQWAHGVSGFAGIMLVLVAGLEILQGIAAISNDAVYVTGINYIYEFDVTAWGWIHVIVGIVAVAVGIAIMLGQTWGLIGGIAIAVISTLTNFVFIPYYPVWSLVLVAFNILVIWALCNRIFHDVPESLPPGSGAGPYGGASDTMSASAYEAQRMGPPRIT